MLVNLTDRQNQLIVHAVGRSSIGHGDAEEIVDALSTPALTDRQRAMAKEALGMAAQLIRDGKRNAGLGGWTNPLETANEIDAIARALAGKESKPCS